MKPEEVDKVFREREEEMLKDRNRAEQLEPLFDESESAREAVKVAIVNRLAATPIWKFWELAHYSLALQTVEAYHLHFKGVMRKGIDAAEELKSPDWVRRRNKPLDED